MNNEVKRISIINENSTYYPHRRYILHKPLKIYEKSEYGYKVGFVNESDRIALCKAAGWRETKSFFIIDGVRLDE